MDTQNVTLTIEKEILRKAKLIAVQRNTSLSGLMRDFLKNLVDEDKEYKKAMELCIREMNKGYNIGAKPDSITRNELHERR